MGQEMEGKFDKSFYSIQLKPTQHNSTQLTKLIRFTHMYTLCIFFGPTPYLDGSSLLIQFGVRHKNGKQQKEEGGSVWGEATGV